MAVDLLGLLTVSAMSVTPALRHDDRLRVSWGERVESSCSMLVCSSAEEGYCDGLFSNIRTGGGVVE